MMKAKIYNFFDIVKVKVKPPPPLPKKTLTFPPNHTLDNNESSRIHLF